MRRGSTAGPGTRSRTTSAIKKIPGWPKASVSLIGSTKYTHAAPTRLSRHPFKPSRYNTARRTSTLATVQPISTAALGSTVSGTANNAANGG